MNIKRKSGRGKTLLTLKRRRVGVEIGEEGVELSKEKKC